MEYQDFTSLPPEQEASFVIYERTSKESGKKAMTMGAIAGGIVGIFAILLFLSFDAAENAHAVDPETDIEEEAPAAAPAPAPEPAEAPAPEEAAAAEPAAADPAAAAATTAPPPPKGATKAPPTALIGK
jgi:hypothetical protein